VPPHFLADFFGNVKLEQGKSLVQTAENDRVLSGHDRVPYVPDQHVFVSQRDPETTDALVSSSCFDQVCLFLFF
jgi:hypothetical protein